MTPYSTHCDDFNTCVYLTTKLDIPGRREPILHFFESLQKTFPKMVDFDRRENGDISLEEEHGNGDYRWVTVEARRLSLGYVNPPAIEELDAMAEHVLEIAPYHLDLSHLDAESLDVVFSFDFTYAGNHDEVVAEALAVGTPLDGLVQTSGSRVINFEPTFALALDENCHLQCRFGIETRTNTYQIRTGQFPEAPITVYFTVRQYWAKQPYKTFVESYRNQRRIAQELVDQHLVPNVLQPLFQVISAKQ
jgi:hypothetical protein